MLITGGYGFIGSHVADRFHKEGYDVFIIDNLSTGKKVNVNFKHKGYILSVNDHKCSEIFKSHKFDVVIHLAAQVSVANSISNPMIDAESNVVGLVNMLNLSAKYRVKKFIYASSAAVYGIQTELPIREEAKCAPISPYGMSKLSGEMYCEKWEELYGIPTLGFRFSNVYGPRQDGLGEGGVISIFMDRIVKEQPLVVYGDGEQTRDFIYVEDIAYAIYRSANSAQTGIYNLSSNTQTSINRIIEIMSLVQHVKEVKYAPRKMGDIDHSVLDNRKIMRDIDWSPLYTIEEGLTKTAAYFIKGYSEQQSATSVITPARTKLVKTYKKVLPTIENLAAFALVAWFTLSISSSAYGGLDVKLFYITIIGVLYGSGQAMVAVMLSSGLFIYQKVLAGRDIISLTYDTDFFFQIAIYLFVGLFVGYAIERKNTIIHRQESEVSELTNRYEFLDSVYNEVREIKDELQLRILNSGDSYGKIYSATKELESLEPEHVFSAAVSVVKSITQAPKVKLYLVSQDQEYIRLLASSGYLSNSEGKSLRVSDHEYVLRPIMSGKMFTNKDLEDDVPLMVAPLFHDDKVKAIIAIDGLPFESFTAYHRNLFRITADLISSALSKAFTYSKATESQRYIEQSMILNSDVFNEILTSKVQAFEQYGTPYLLLHVKPHFLSYKETAEYLSSKLRETDYIGLDEQYNLVVLLSNTSKDDEEYILNRLALDSIDFSTITEGKLVWTG